MRPTTLNPLAAIAVVLLTAIAPSPAPAASGVSPKAQVSIISGTLNVIGNDTDEALSVSCLSGDLQVNFAPYSPTTACATITGLNINGAGGDDTISANTTAGTFPSLATSTIAGGGGDDDIIGGHVGNLIQGNAGHDRIRGSSSAVDQLFGGGGVDRLDVLSSGNILLVDTSTTTSHVDPISSFESAFLSASNPGGVTVNASSFSGSVSIEGSMEADVLVGGPMDDEIRTLDGADSVDGEGGADTIVIDAVPGSMTITDNAVNVAGITPENKTMTSIERTRVFAESVDAVTIDGTAFSGRQEIYGGNGADTILGGPANDTFHWSPLNDSYDGNGGTDRVVLSSGSVEVIGDQLITDGTGTDTFSDVERLTAQSNEDGDTIDVRQFPGPVVFDDDSGAGDGDVFLGSDFGDKASGANGDDTFRGFGGNDTLSGNRGDDTLVGGEGNDTCRGGPGANTIRSCE